jgi:energy-coupling factor transporter ATP-binding protein EcfA2
MLFAETVADELAFTRRAKGIPASDDAPLLQTLGLSEMRQDYPRDLSVGERQRVALAAVLVGDPELILLDEPTRGLDYVQKAALTAFLQTQKERSKAIIVITHDVELVAQCADRAIVLDDGEIVADGPVRQVMSAWPLFASQINRLFSDPQFLTVEDVMAVVDQAGTVP